MTTFSASLTNITVLLPQSHDCSCYVSKRVLALSPLSLQKHTDLRAHDFLWHQLRLAKLPAPEAGDFVELILLYNGRSAKLVTHFPLWQFTETHTHFCQTLARCNFDALEWPCFLSFFVHFNATYEIPRLEEIWILLDIWDKLKKTLQLRDLSFS
jgi:hypothetical protein